MNKLKSTFLALLFLPLATFTFAANISTTTGLDANTPFIDVIRALDNGQTVLTLANPIVTGSVLSGYTTTATAAGTTTLTKSSSGMQFFTGSTTQNVVLPVATTMTVGQAFTIENLSSGLVTVKSSGSNTVKILVGGTRCRFTCVAASGTDATSWDAFYESANAASGKIGLFSNTLTFTGTDGSSVAFGAGGTAAYTSNNLSVFAATTSAQLAGVISDETGSGASVFATSPTLVTPVIGAATGTSLAATGSIKSSSPSAGIGYATGAGGAVTQITTRSTGVTMVPNPCISGTITTVNSSLAAETAADFIVTDSAVAIGDVVVVCIQSGSNGGDTSVSVSTVTNGTFTIRIANNNAAAGTAETGVMLINFAIIKAVSS